MTEKEKMLAGEWFSSPDEELTVERRRTERLLRRLNVELTADDEAYRTTLRELLAPGSEGFIRAPFYCDYGYNISLGRGTFLNFDCVILDLASVRIGCRTLIGPKVQLLTAHHPFDVQQRAAGLEAGRPIEIGDDCWLGGGVIVCPGVRIGNRVIIGAGAWSRATFPTIRWPWATPPASSAPRANNPRGRKSRDGNRGRTEAGTEAETKPETETAAHAPARSAPVVRHPNHARNAPPKATFRPREVRFRAPEAPFSDSFSYLCVFQRQS